MWAPSLIEQFSLLIWASHYYHIADKAPEYNVTKLKVKITNI